MSLKHSFRSITCICVSMAQTIILPLPFFGEQFACWFVPNCHHFLTDYPTISGQKTSKICTKKTARPLFHFVDTFSARGLGKLLGNPRTKWTFQWEYPRAKFLGFSGNSCLIAEGTWDWDYDIIQQLVLLLRSFGCVSCLIAALQSRTLLPQFPESPHGYVWITGYQRTSRICVIIFW